MRVGSVVYTNAGTYGGLYGINASDGSQKFFQSLDQYDSWSAGYFSGRVYTFIAGHFRTHDANTGAVTAQLDLTWNWSGYTMSTAPVFNATRAFVIAPPNLVAIDGYVYVASDANVYAVDISTQLLVDQKPAGGWLSVGSHRLILAGQDGTMTAYVLAK